MKHISLHKLLLVTFFCVTSIPHTFTESNSDIITQENQIDSQTDNVENVHQKTAIEDALSVDQIAQAQHAAQEYLESVITQAKSVLDEIYSLLSGLSLMVNDGQIKTVINKKDITTKLQELSIMIHGLHQQQLMVIDIPTANAFLELNNGIMQHLLKAIKNDLRTLPNFNPQDLIKRSHNQDPEAMAQKLESKLANNQALLKTLKKEAEVVGLAWYNIAYRKFDSAIIAPTQKYALHKWAAGITSASALGILAWWHLSDGNKNQNGAVQFLNKTWTGLGDKVLGSQPESFQVFPSNWKDCGYVGRIDYYLWKTLSSGYAQTAAFLGAMNYEKIGNLYSKKIYPAVSNKIAAWHNTLKGGEYLKRAAQIQRIHEDVEFDDLVGCNEVKETFKEIVQFIKDPGYYARRGLEPPKGVLLVGPSRSGKSYSVNALATAVKKMTASIGQTDEFRYIPINAADIQEAGGVDELMRLVKHAAPCILFIDEIDLLDLQRKGYNPTLMAFLTNMSGAMNNKDPKKQVILIGATTNPENLDKALRQDGRFEKEILFELPTFNERVEFILRKVKKLALSPEFFDVAKIAHETEGRTYATLNRLINRAALNACFEGRVVTQEDIDTILDVEIRHIIANSTKDIPVEDQLIVASHFSGQALMLGLINSAEKLSKVTIKPIVQEVKEQMMGAHLWDEKSKADSNSDRITYGGLFTHHEGDQINIKSYDEKLNAARVLLAGFIAEEIVFGASGYDCNKQDLDHAMQIIQSIAFEGINVEKLPQELQVEYHRKALQLLEQCKQEVRDMLEQNKDRLMLFIQTLIGMQTLDGDMANVIMNIDMQELQKELEAAQQAVSNEAQEIKEENVAQTA